MIIRIQTVVYCSGSGRLPRGARALRRLRVFCSVFERRAAPRFSRPRVTQPAAPPAKTRVTVTRFQRGLLLPLCPTKRNETTKRPARRARRATATHQSAPRQNSMHTARLCRARTRGRETIMRRFICSLSAPDREIETPAAYVLYCTPPGRNTVHTAAALAVCPRQQRTPAARARRVQTSNFKSACPAWPGLARPQALPLVRCTSITSLYVLPCPPLSKPAGAGLRPLLYSTITARRRRRLARSLRSCPVPPSAPRRYVHTAQCTRTYRQTYSMSRTIRLAHTTSRACVCSHAIRVSFGFVDVRSGGATSRISLPPSSDRSPQRTAPPSLPLPLPLPLPRPHATASRNNAAVQSASKEQNATVAQRAQHFSPPGPTFQIRARGTWNKRLRVCGCERDGGVHEDGRLPTTR